MTSPLIISNSIKGVTNNAICLQGCVIMLYDEQENKDKQTIFHLRPLVSQLGCIHNSELMLVFGFLLITKQCLRPLISTSHHKQCFSWPSICFSCIYIAMFETLTLPSVIVLVFSFHPIRSQQLAALQSRPPARGFFPLGEFFLAAADS